MRFNILIRTHNRLKYFARLLRSIPKKDWIHLVVAVDNERSAKYAGRELRAWTGEREGFTKRATLIRVATGEQGKAPYNMYFRQMYPYCTPGFIHHMDDDDWYLPHAFQTLSLVCRRPDTVYMFPYLKGPEGQLTTKPPARHWKSITCGKVGTPNIVVHSKMNPAGWTPHMTGDYSFIKTMCKARPVVWINNPIVRVQQRNYGKPEEKI